MSASEYALIDWEFFHGTQSGPWEVWRAVLGHMNDYTPPWEPVRAPHCTTAADCVDPDGPYYQGEAWYRTLVPVPGVDWEREDLRLDFHGVGQNCEVFMYLESVAEHRGGYDAFEVDLTAAARRYLDAHPEAETLPLALRVDNRRRTDTVPSDLADFVLHGGLHRPVALRVLPKRRVEALRLFPVLTESRSGQLSVEADLTGPAEPCRWTFRLRDPGGDTVLERRGELPSGTSALRLEDLEAGTVRPWSPDTPDLYAAELSVDSCCGEQTLTCRAGFRSFEFIEHGPFHLNGERLPLRGTHRHEDHAGVGSAMTADQTRNELEKMKAMGVNFLRLGHYQQDDLVLDLCDELGILVWEEIPWCRGGLGGDAHREHTRAMLESMIRRHRNHPCVILWGLGNENDWPGDYPAFDKTAIRAHMAGLHDRAKELDPSRPTTIRRCAFCEDVVDVYSPSIWAGWYRGTYHDYRPATEGHIDRLPRFLHVEWGADHHYGRYAENPYKTIRGLRSGGDVDERAGDFLLEGGDHRAARDGDWSETYACDLIDWHLKEQAAMPRLTGTAYWLFKDFATPLRPDNPVPYVNQKGVVDRASRPKESYYVFQSWWTHNPMVHIHGERWTRRWTEPGQSNRIRVYSNCPEVELFVNGQSRGTRRRDPTKFPCAGLVWDLDLFPGDLELRAVARTATGQRVEHDVNTELVEAVGEIPARIELRAERVDDGHVRVEALLRDPLDRPCLESRAFLHFSLAGDGSLLDNLGTADGARRVQAANGQAGIGVNLRKGQRAVVAAASDGCPTAWVELDFSGLKFSRQEPRHPLSLLSGKM